MFLEAGWKGRAHGDFGFFFCLLTVDLLAADSIGLRNGGLGRGTAGSGLV